MAKIFLTDGAPQLRSQQLLSVFYFRVFVIHLSTISRGVVHPDRRTIFLELGFWVWYMSPQVRSLRLARCTPAVACILHTYY